MKSEKVKINNVSPVAERSRSDN